MHILKARPPLWPKEYTLETGYEDNGDGFPHFVEYNWAPNDTVYEIHQWAVDNMGPRYENWMASIRRIWFREHTDLTAFVLRWTP